MAVVEEVEEEEDMKSTIWRTVSFADNTSKCLLMIACLNLDGTTDGRSILLIGNTHRWQRHDKTSVVGGLMEFLLVKGEIGGLVECGGCGWDFWWNSF